jgi:hypothetical protein
MKTVIIWEVCFEEVLFFEVEGDLRKFHRCYIGTDGDNQAVEDEFSLLMFGDEGDFNFPTFQEFPVDAVVQGAFVIVAGIA